MPTRLYDETLSLSVGSIAVELRHADIHTCDGTVLWLPDRCLLFAGDTLEDTITFVGEPDRVQAHLSSIRMLAALPVKRILPNHGVADIIAAGGYGPAFIAAAEHYLSALLRCRSEPALAALDLRDFVAEDLASGAITWYEPYAAVHRANVKAVLSTAA